MAIRFASHPHGALKKYQENVPKGIFRICPKCGSKFIFIVLVNISCALIVATVFG